MKMASSQDVTFSEGAIEEGRKLANKLWNAAGSDLQAWRDRAGRAPRVARGALDPRAAVGDAARARGLPRPLRLLAPRRRALPPDLRRLLRLVPGGDQAAHLRRRHRRARHRRRGARAAAQAAAPGHAARDGGDLVEPAGTGEPVDRRSLARDRRHDRGRRARPRPGGGRALPAQRRADAARGRREAHLRRGRQARTRRRPTATSRSSEAGCARRSSAPRRCSATTGFIEQGSRRGRRGRAEKLERYRRELDALGG